MSAYGKVGAVIAAAGESQRMNGVDKVFAPLAGKLILVQVVNVFQSCNLIDDIVIVLNPQNFDLARGLIQGQKWSKVRDIRPGGLRRRDSVAEGLKGLSKCDWVVVHDGARPLVTHDLISRGLEEAKATGAAVSAVPVTDTIKVVGEDMLVRGTPPRSELWAVQTPQIFRFDILQRAHREVKAEVTDDASLVEKLGYPVKLYMGAYDNIKITAPIDLVVAEALLKKRMESK